MTAPPNTHLKDTRDGSPQGRGPGRGSMRSTTARPGGSRPTGASCLQQRNQTRTDVAPHTQYRLCFERPCPRLSAALTKTAGLTIGPLRPAPTDRAGWGRMPRPAPRLVLCHPQPLAGSARQGPTHTFHPHDQPIMPTVRPDKGRGRCPTLPSCSILGHVRPVM